MKHALSTIFICFLTHAFSQVSWFQITDFPGTERDDGATFEINGKVYCFSELEVGWNCTADGFVFNPSNETWSTMASLPAGAQRQYATAFAHSGFGYVLGGVDCSNTALNDFFNTILQMIHGQVCRIFQAWEEAA